MNKIICRHTEPVAAGTLVRFEVPDRDQRTGTPFVWTVVGPRPQDTQQIPTSEPVLVLDTSQLLPAAYDVNARRAATDEAPDPDRPDEGTVDDEPAGPFGSVVPRETAVARGLPVAKNAVLRAPGDYEPFVLKVVAPAASGPGGIVPVSLQRTSVAPTDDQVLWIVIRNRTNAISFRSYKIYMDRVMGEGRLPNGDVPVPAFRGPHAYDLLMRATDAFLMHETGVLGGGSLDVGLAQGALEEHFRDPGMRERLRNEEARRLGRPFSLDALTTMRSAYYDRLAIEEPALLPYLGRIRERLSEVPVKGPEEIAGNAYGILPSALTGPAAIELIWSYWQEEGMLVQTLNAILARFQNRRSGARDPLARFDLDPLRPMANLFWGWVQDEMKRLTVRRRSYEYEHEYGLRLIGLAVPGGPAADRRSRFVEALHNLLYLSHVFFKEDDDTTVLADGFPLLNALRETHLVLAEGAHNQFGDLPTTARAEMLVMQWLLARPEMREFLGGRVMVPYEEPWMDRVDSMRAMQGWGDTSVTHFRDMAVYGEQLLLSIRYGDWSSVNDPQQAANWARYWRPEVQRYTHAYRSATGVDLTERVDATVPSFLLQRRAAAARAVGR